MENSVEGKLCINKKLRAQSSQFRFTYVMMNMKFLAVITSLSIYHGCSTQKTFWEVNFTDEKKGTLGQFSAVNMKIYGRLNVRKHRDIKGGDKYVTFNTFLKFDSVEKMRIISSESKVELVR